MSKKILKLEKETNMWKSRWEKSQTALLEMATDKQTRDNEIANMNKKCSLLQELCKAFQQERATLLAQLKESSGKLSNDPNNIEDNQEFIESVDKTSANPVLNGTAVTEESPCEKKTKDLKTESTVTLSKTNPDEVVREESKLILTADTSNGTTENTTETVNINKEQMVVENMYKKSEQSLPLLEKTNGESKDDKLPQVPVDVTDVNKTEITSSNCDESINPIKTLKNDSSSVILSTCRGVESIKESEINEEQIKLEKLVISEKTVTPKEQNQIESLDSTAVSNEDISHEVSKKK